jgi:hypothetical protein
VSGVVSLSSPSFFLSIFSFFLFILVIMIAKKNVSSQIERIRNARRRGRCQEYNGRGT